MGDFSSNVSFSGVGKSFKTFNPPVKSSSTHWAVSLISQDPPSTMQTKIHLQRVDYLDKSIHTILVDGFNWDMFNWYM